MNCEAKLITNEVIYFRTELKNLIDLRLDTEEA